ncbi:MAG: YhdP family protein, partial [Pseudomonadota bacterium]|nr:YhdP family protein [Pseudomonadota bacterium]
GGIVGLSPGIRFQGVQILNRDRSEVLVSVAEVDARLSWWRSFRGGVPAVSYLLIREPVIEMERSTNGDLRIGDLVLSGGGAGGDDGFIEWLKHQARMVVTDASIGIRDLSGDIARHQTVEANLWLRHRAGAMEVVTRGRFQGHVDGAFEAAARLWWRGGEALPNAEIHLHSESLYVATLPGGARDLAGRLSLDGWFRAQQGRVIAATGHATLQDGRLRLREAGEPAGLSEITGSFLLRRSGDSWSGRLSDVAVYAAGEDPWRAEELTFRYESAGALLTAAGRGADLALLAEIPQLGKLLDSAALTRLDAMQPKGLVEDLRIQISLAGEKQARLLALDGRLKGVSLISVDRWPGVEGLDAALTLRDDVLRIRVDSPRARVWWAEIWRAPADFERFEGELMLSRSGADWRAGLRQFVAANDDLMLVGDGEVGTVAGGAPHLSLAFRLPRMRLSGLHHYLPAGIMSPSAVRWFDDAIQQGTAGNGRLLVAGDGATFPWREGNGRFIAQAEVSDAVLDYAPNRDWPRLESLDARLALDGTRLQVTASRGRILDSEMTGADAIIPDLAARPLKVGVSGTVLAGAENTLRIFRDSELRDRIGGPFRDWHAEGSVGIDLALDITVAKQPVVVANGTAELDLASLDMRSTTGLTATQVRGTLAFGNQGVAADPLHAVLLGGPARIAVSSDRRDDRLWTRISGSGTLDSGELGKYLGLGGALLSGDTDWEAQLEVGGRELDITLRSGLDGVRIDAPRPLGKSAAEHKPLAAQVVCDCASDSPVLRVDVELGATLSAALELVSTDDGGWFATRGTLSAGGDRASLPASGTWLKGAVPQIQFAEWLYWYRGLAGGKPLLDIDHIDAEFEQVSLFGRPFRKVGVKAEKRQVEEGANWRFDLRGNDVKGVLETVGGPSPAINLQLDYLAWRGGDGSQELRRSNPTRIPRLRVDIAELFYEDRAVGRLVLDAHPVPTGTVFDRMELHKDSTRLTGTMQWRADGQGDQSTLAKMRADTGDLGELFRLLGVRELVAGGSGQVQFDGEWPGGPNDFQLSALTGTVTANLTKGSLLGIEPGVGRLFGILSLQSVERRLTLNFDDVVGTGLVYDKLVADLALSSGLGELTMFDLHGPATEIAMRGQIDFTRRTVDLDAVSIPQVTSSLPVAGAIGSLGLGAAILLGQRLLEPQIERWTTRRYDISGPWNNPQVNRVSVNGARNSPPGPDG